MAIITGCFPPFFRFPLFFVYSLIREPVQINSVEKKIRCNLRELLSLNLKFVMVQKKHDFSCMSQQVKNSKYFRTFQLKNITAFVTA